MIEPFKLEALINWLIAGAPPKIQFAKTAAELARRVTAAGLPINTLGIYMLNINPMVLGTLVSWTPRGGTKLVRVSHEEMAGPRWQGTIPHAAITTARVIRHRIGSDNELDSIRRSSH